MSLFKEPYFIWEGQTTEVEWAVNVIKTTTDIQLRRALMTDLFLHELDFPDPKLKRILVSLSTYVNHKKIEKAPTTYDQRQPGMELPNSVFLTHTKAKKINRITGKVEEEMIEIDMWKLRLWIIERFTPQYNYDWFALWKFFKDQKLLKTLEIRAFANQMNEWFETMPNNWTALANDRSMNHYKPYLADRPYIEWNKQDFLDLKKKEATEDGYNRIKGLIENHFLPFALINLKKERKDME